MNAQAWKEMDDVARGLREAAKASSPTDAEEMCAEQMEFLNGMIDDEMQRGHEASTGFFERIAGGEVFIAAGILLSHLVALQQKLDLFEDDDESPPVIYNAMYAISKMIMNAETIACIQIEPDALAAMVNVLVDSRFRDDTRALCASALCVQDENCQLNAYYADLKHFASIFDELLKSAEHISVQNAFVFLLNQLSKWHSDCRTSLQVSQRDGPDPPSVDSRQVLRPNQCIVHCTPSSDHLQTITAALQDLQKRYGELDYTRCQNGKLEPSPHRLLGEYNLRNSAGSILCTMPLEMKVATVVTHPPGLGMLTCPTVCRTVWLPGRCTASRRPQIGWIGTWRT